MSKFVNRSGERYGRLVALRPLAERRNNHVVWRCRCDCGTIIEVTGGCLTSGHIQSCGCLNRESSSARVAQQNLTHGRSRQPEYFAWQDMRYACTNPQNQRYPVYGAKGITVCEQWDSSFEAFLADLGPRPSPKHRLVRLDKSGNFEPGNVEWRCHSNRREGHIAGGL